MEEELLLEKHDPALCTISESNWFLPSDSQEGRCGSSAPTIWLEDEGDIGCDDSHTVTETDEGSHPIEESSRPFQIFPDALLKKGAKWNWTNECQKALDTIKKMLIKPPVLVMPNLTGRFTLVSDTSKLATGAASYQEQQGVLRLVAYNSKQLPEAAKRYSISELELLGLTINIASFKHYLKGENFSVVIDHSALVYIINSKKEPPTLRLKKLLEILSQYSFNIRYFKGKEMYISDFLSRHPGNDTSSPNEIIPIAFIMKDFSEYIKEISPISTAFVMQTWSDYGEKRDQVCDLRDIECEEIEPREEHFDKNERCTEIKSINTEACKTTKIESQNTLEECNITTRGMRQRTGDKPPAI